jgi:uncharacterized lipoprotein YddW (UPF0748 family)
LRSVFQPAAVRQGRPLKPPRRASARASRRLLLQAVGGWALAGCAPAQWPLQGGTAAPGTAAAPQAAAPPAAAAAAGAAAPAAQALTEAEMPPPEAREFRAAWVASVAHIDWPSAPGLTPEQQRREALAMLGQAQAMGLNALILQVRPAGDALYASTLEPWSEFLTGAQGRAPEPWWDPLAFWVREAHLRGLELHVWFNPYRARAAAAKNAPPAPLVAPHLGALRPELVKRYGEMLWMDPGEPDAAAHTLAVVADVVRRYDIDGVHIDDYFYPYPVSVDGVEQPFPDDESYARYRLGGGALAREDWRRANVDRLVQQMHRTVQAIKPWVRFGISPFGVGRPDRRPPGIIGFSQYDKLYADVERWLENGWLDYLAPQLYWQIERPGLQFPQLLDYWVGQNTAGRHVWPGLFTSLITKGEPGTVLGTRAWLAREVLDQVAHVRGRDGAAPAALLGSVEPAAAATPALPPPAASPAAPAVPPPVASPAAPVRPPRAGNPGATGHIHFSMVALMQDRDGIATLLKFGPYAQAALVPATPWLAAPVPAAPRLRWVDLPAGRRVVLDFGGDTAAQRLAVWRRVGGQWRLAVLPASQTVLDPAGADAVVVSAIGRNGQLSPRASLRVAAWTALPPRSAAPAAP